MGKIPKLENKCFQKGSSPRFRKTDEGISFLNFDKVRWGYDTDIGDFSFRRFLSSKDIESFAKIKSVHTEELDLDLENPITAKISFHDGSWIWENEDLGIVAMGKNKKEARNDFQKYFEFLYDTYYKEDDENLRKNGLKIKNKLKKLID